MREIAIWLWRIITALTAMAMYKHTFSWASSTKRLTSTSCTYFHLQLTSTLLKSAEGRDCSINNFIINLHERMESGRRPRYAQKTELLLFIPDWDNSISHTNLWEKYHNRTVARSKTSYAIVKCQSDAFVLCYISAYSGTSGNHLFFLKETVLNGEQEKTYTRVIQNVLKRTP